LPDYLKEEVQALREAIDRLTAANEAQKGFHVPPPGRVLGTRVPLSGGPSHLTQDLFTTGFDGTNTTVPFTLDFSPLDMTGSSGDILTM